VDLADVSSPQTPTNITQIGHQILVRKILTKIILFNYREKNSHENQPCRLSL
jgi:hypothetical protein